MKTGNMTGITIHHADCLAELATLPADSFDACVTDPPYGLGFMGKGWDKFNPSEFQFWCRGWAEELFRVLKPGAHLVAFGGTRTYHRMVCAIEDAGFEIRDCIQWIYGSGFPKSHDVSKGIDRAAGAERERVGSKIITGLTPSRETFGANDRTGGKGMGFRPGEVAITAPATDAARQWQGWGTALKPACEPIVLARKPLSEGTVAANVLRWGTGAINVDGCRVEITDRAEYENNAAGRLERLKQSGQNVYSGKITHNGSPSSGRWPANVVHDGSNEVVQGFPDSEGIGGNTSGSSAFGQNSGWNAHNNRTTFIERHNDTGSAARFFYTAKADGDERIGSKHPTVKPIDLMQWLVRLVTPKGGLVLDPFAGTGTTGEAAWREGCRATLIEREAEYIADIKRRLELMQAGPDERNREIVKASGKTESHETLPLFGFSLDPR